MESVSSTALSAMSSTALGARPLEFLPVYRAYFGFSWASLRRLGVPAASIDDATQDFWVTVHRRLSTVETSASIKAWLFGVARRVASHYRRRDFRNRRKLAALGATAGPGADHSMKRRDVGMALEVALGRLDEPKRTAFVLSELEGWSAPEIARAVGSKPNTIYSRIRLAKEQLRADLQDSGERRPIDEMIAETRDGTQPPKGASKRCLLAIGPQLATAAPGVVTPMVAGIAKLKLALVGAAMGAVVVAGINAAVPQVNESATSASPPIEITTAQTVHAKTQASAQPPAPVAPTPGASSVMASVAPRAAFPSPARTQPGSEPAGGLQDETRLLTAAQLALTEGDPSGALEHVAQHAQRFPSGALRPLRLVLEVEALCAADRRADARRIAEAAGRQQLPPAIATRLSAACAGPL